MTETVKHKITIIIMTGAIHESSAEEIPAEKNEMPLSGQKKDQILFPGQGAFAFTQPEQTHRM